MATGYIESLEFRVTGLPDDTFEVFRMEGTEAISEPFRFEVDLVADDPEMAIETLPGYGASLTIIYRDDRREFHGIIGPFRQGALTERGRFVYHATLVPRITLLDLSRQNQIHGTTTAVSVIDVIRTELTADGLRGPGAALAGRISAADIEFRLSQQYPAHDYIAQYQESDLAFISRLAEEHGIFYFFEHNNGRDVIVFGDSRVAFSPAHGDAGLRYRRVSGLLQDTPNLVSDFIHDAGPMPAKVVLRDYNYRLPHLSLRAEADVDPNGHGVVVEHGDHFATPEEGLALARIRAEEIRCHAERYRGISNCLWLSSGHLFELSEHFRSSYNGRYTVTRVTHSATRAVDGIADVTGGALESTYSNTFECLPNTVEFRPKRVTPRPVMAGLYNATIDAEGSGTRAELDDQGRYKIRQNFDLRDEADGKASMYVRKAEPYGGENGGMHFPLLKGTDVVVACVNGDPDRPVILGAVPNPRNRSVVTSTNQTSNRIRTTSGSMIQIDDGNSVGSSSGSSTGSGAALAPQRSLESPSGTLEATRAHMATYSDTSRVMVKSTGTSSSASDDSYLRLGSKVSDGSEDDYVSGSKAVSSTDGILVFTSGDTNSMISGASYRKVTGDIRDVAANVTQVAKTKSGIVAKRIGLTAQTSEPGDTDTIDDDTSDDTAWTDGGIQIKTDTNLIQTIGGSVKTTVSADSTSVWGGSSASYTAGATFSFFAGAKCAISGGLNLTIDLATSLRLNSGLTLTVYFIGAVTVTLGYNVQYAWGVLIKYYDGVETITRTAAKVENNLFEVNASAVEANAKSVEASAKSVEATSSSVKAESPAVEAKVQSVSVEVPAIKATI